MKLGFEFNHDKVRWLIGKRVVNRFYIYDDDSFNINIPLVKNFIKTLETEYKNFNLYNIINFSLDFDNFTLSCIGKSLEKKENINQLIENLNNIRNDIKFNLKKIIGKKDNKEVLLLNISKSLSNKELNKDEKRNLMKNLINNLFNLENLEDILVILNKNKLNMEYDTIFSKITNKNNLYELRVRKEIFKGESNPNIFLTSKIYCYTNNSNLDLIKVFIRIHYPYVFYSKSYGRFNYVNYDIEIIDNIKNEHIHILVNKIEIKIRNIINENERNYKISFNYLDFLNRHLNIYSILIMFFILNTITFKEKITQRFEDLEIMFLIN